MFSLEERRFWADLIAAFQYLKRAYKKDRERLVVAGHGSGRARGNCFALGRG